MSLRLALIRSPLLLALALFWGLPECVALLRARRSDRRQLRS